MEIRIEQAAGGTAYRTYTPPNLQKASGPGYQPEDGTHMIPGVNAPATTPSTSPTTPKPVVQPYTAYVPNPDPTHGGSIVAAGN